MSTNRPSERHSNAARTKIHRAALRLYADNGPGPLSISDLAVAAGIARGTIYNNIEEPERLFGDVAHDLSREMIARVERTIGDIDDPVERLATGVRLLVRRAHEDHDWGRFIIRFALSSPVLHSLMLEPPARDVSLAIAQGRFKVAPTQTKMLLTLLVGSTLAAMNAVIQGEQAWREAASTTAEFFLRASGISPSAAKRIAHRPLPDLAAAQTAREKGRKNP